MVWLAVDKDGTEKTCSWKPDRNKKLGIWTDRPCMVIPEGTIKKILGRNLSWHDEPVEI